VHDLGCRGWKFLYNMNFISREVNPSPIAMKLEEDENKSVIQLSHKIKKYELEKSMGRNITKYLVFEGLDVVKKTTMLDNVEISSLAKPSDGVGFASKVSSASPVA
jgi:hypothetical protein